MSRGKQSFLATAGLALAIAFTWANPASAQVTTSGSVAGTDELAPAAPVVLSVIVDSELPSVTIEFEPSVDDFVRQVPASGDLTSGGTFVNTNDVAGYLVIREDDAGGQVVFDPAELGEGANGLVFLDLTVENGTDYVYTVVAFDASGNEGAAAPEVAVVEADIEPPRAPRRMTLTLNYRASSQEFNLRINVGSSPDDLGSADLDNRVDSYRFESTGPATVTGSIAADGSAVYRETSSFTDEGDVTIRVFAVDEEEGLESAPIEGTVTARVPPIVKAVVRIQSQIVASQLSPVAREILTDVFARQLALLANLPEFRIRIINISDGSLVVDFEILESEDPAEPDAVSPQEAFVALEQELVAEPETFTQAVTEDVAAEDEDLAAELQLEAPVVAEIVQSTLSLGSAFKGEELAETRTVTNQLDVEDTITITVEGDGYSVSAASLTLGAGEEGSFDIAFTGTANGDFNGTVTVSSGDSANPGESISVSATVVPDPPSIAVSDDALAYGTVNLGEPATESFTISNEGEVDLEFSTLVLGDRVFSADPSDGVVAGGESVDVEVTFASNFGGFFEASLRITHNDPDADPQVVALSARGVIPVLDLVGDVVEFGEDVPINTTRSETSTLSNPGSGTIEGTITLSGDEAFSVSEDGDFTLLPDESLDIEITYAPTAEGASSGTITIASNDLNNPELTITLAGSAVTLETSRVEVSTDAIAFELTTVGDSSEETLTISNTGGIDLVSSIAIDGDAFTLDIEEDDLEDLAPGESIEVTVVFTPGASIDYTGTITVTTNDPDTPETTVALSGTGEAAPEFEADLELSSDTIEFDDTTVGGTSEMTLTISNSGDADLTSSIAIDGDAFTLDTEGDLADLAPGESVEVTVVFAPTDVIDYTGTITVTSNGGDDTVDLSGSGLAVGSPVRIGVHENGNDLFGYLSRDSDGNLDDVINLADFFIFADAFGKSPGDGGHNPGADFNQDGKINLADFFSFADSFGKTAVSFRN